MWDHSSTPLQVIVITCLVLIIGFLCMRSTRSKRILAEGFTDSVTTLEGKRQNIHKSTPDEIYDTFYAEVYDQLFQSDAKNEYECLQIHKNYIKPWTTSKVRVLDAGCGTGHHLRILHRYGNHVEGLDSSMDMVKRARRNCPKAIVRKGNLEDASVYPKRHFTHITCFFFTIYYCNNIDALFQNWNRWLEPKGYLFVHVVNPKKFDPVLERASSLIPLFDPQRHSNKRQTHTTLEFKEFTYEGDWDLTQPKKAHFEERFHFKNEPYDRYHSHKLCFLSSKKIITRANKNGFELIKAIDLFLVGHNYNYIMCFQKKFGD
jgi:SAM-dependent methyltransferase